MDRVISMKNVLKKNLILIFLIGLGISLLGMGTGVVIAAKSYSKALSDGKLIFNAPNFSRSVHTALRKANHLATYGGVEFYVDKAFTFKQRQVIDLAAKKYVYRRDKQEIYNCVRESTRYDTVGSFGLGTEVPNWAISMKKRNSFINRGDRIFIFAGNNSGTSKTKVAGLATLSQADTIAQKNNNIYFSLGQDLMKSEYINGQSYHYWAGVIAHEINHALGYKHRDAGYSSTAIKVQQKCIADNRSGNFLNDRELETSLSLINELPSSGSQVSMPPTIE